MRHAEMEARLAELRGRALSELQQVAGFEDILGGSDDVEKTAGAEAGNLDEQFDKVASRIDEILKVANHTPLHTVGKPRAQVAETGELTRNRVTSMGGSMHVAPKGLQSTTGASAATAVARTKGSNVPEKTASAESRDELRARLNAQFGFLRDEGSEDVEKVANAGSDTGQFMDDLKANNLGKTVRNFDAFEVLKDMDRTSPGTRSGGPQFTRTGDAAKTLTGSPQFTRTGSAAGTGSRTAGNATDMRARAFEAIAEGAEAPNAAKAAKAGMVDNILAYLGQNKGRYGIAAALAATAGIGIPLALRKEGGLDSPNGLQVYEGMNSGGETLNAPGSNLIRTNESAMNFTRRDAKAPVRASLRSLLSEPALSSSGDPVAHQALGNAAEHGVKIAGMQQTEGLSLREILTGGPR